MTAIFAKRIARNTAWFTVGSVLQKLISFAYFSVIAMAFGVEGTGRYFFALAFTALFGVAADWGVSSVLTREIAKERTAGAALIIPACIIKGVSGVLAAGIITILAIVLGYDDAARRMIAIATIVMVLDTIHLGMYACLRGLQRVHYEALGLVMSQAVLTVSGIGMLVWLAGLRYDAGASPVLSVARDIQPLWLLIPYVAASVTNLLLASFGFIRERVWQSAPRPAMRGTIGWLLRTATPFAIAGGLARLYTYLDTFLLRTLLHSGALVAVGMYSVAFKITFAFQFIPLAFMGALYPAMSALASCDQGKLRSAFEHALRLLWLIAVPMACGLAALAYRIVPFLYGAAFRASALPLAILAASLPFIFGNFPCGNLLNACGRQTANSKLLALATAVNVAVNVMCIPFFGAVGAAIAACVASVVLFVSNLLAVRRSVAYGPRTLLTSFMRPLAASTVMLLVIVPLHMLPLALVIVVGVCAYVVTIVMVGGLRRSDMLAFRRYFMA